MNILIIIQLLGGVGLFLFGMDLMGSYLKKLAGSSLARILEKLTTAKSKGVGYIKGWGLGAGVTAIIQSSAATTIMLIGFVNAGIMSLIQAIPVVYGANVGSTVTAQILRLGDLSSKSVALQLLKPSAFAPMLVGIGAFIILFVKNKRVKNIAGIMVGLGILFYGMTTMEEVFEPLRESPEFQKLFVSFENPLIGVLTGLVITAVIQSSSASVGILQALSATGAVTFGTAFPIIVGQNIGKCMTILMGSIGAGKEAKRVSASYLIFNLIGAVLFTIPVYLIYYTVGIPLFAKIVNRGDIANIHLMFNLVTSILLLPFSEQMAALTERIIGKEKEDPDQKEFARLDDLLLKTPTVALSQCLHLAGLMQKRIQENYRLAIQMINQPANGQFEQLEKNEAFIDQCETALLSYIIRIDRKKLPKPDRKIASELLRSVSDFERIGDYSINIAYIAKDMNEANTVFTQAGYREIETIASATSHQLSTLWKAFDTNSRTLAIHVEPLGEVIDELKDVIKQHHIGRLTRGECSVQGGADLYDMLTCFERISSHANNVALHIIAVQESDKNFDQGHGHVTDINSEEYKLLQKFYRDQYMTPVVTPNSAEDGDAEESEDPVPDGQAVPAGNA